jgi:hypothetical protein
MNKDYFNYFQIKKHEESFYLFLNGNTDDDDFYANLSDDYNEEECLLLYKAYKKRVTEASVNLSVKKPKKSI